MIAISCLIIGFIVGFLTNAALNANHSKPHPTTEEEHCGDAWPPVIDDTAFKPTLKDLY